MDKKDSEKLGADDVFWADQIAKKVIEREKRLNRNVDVYRTEMGLGASGIPHVGSAGDGIRSYVVALALQELGYRSELIAFSDNRDGLRKVPVGFPASLRKDIGKPVSMIDDPFGCHKSFGDHVSSLLIDAFEKIGVKYRLQTGDDAYRRGLLDNEIIEILKNAQQAGKIIFNMTNQDKYTKQLPFLPVCEKCGRIYTTRAYKFLPDEKKILYKCDASFVGKDSNTGEEIIVKGCGHEGECSIRDGKLSWKVEFAARWRALRINYEAYGKDIADSVAVNDEICRQILGWEPPVHSFYELFVERGGGKISKSKGNVFTPQTWLKYGNKESIRLLFLKRLGTTRVVDLQEIPKYMEEVDGLSKIYYNEDKRLIKKLSNKELAHAKRLYEYVYFLNPEKPAIVIPYRLLVGFVKLVKDKNIVKDILRKTGHVPEKMSPQEEKELDRRIEYAMKWVEDALGEEKKIEITERQRKALRSLAEQLQPGITEEELYSKFFEIAKANNIDVKKFFAGAYAALLGSDRGPRLAPLIIAIGVEKVKNILESV
ncbi:MAG: lysine--tRNA ligase [Candidatus Aenigmarchaeota archaeon]|nr:lysine--tRNA ligase [Candidatus Aenigmarchaeota archaeon]OYT58173.1 MAG: lysine--tRNA ligase [Candidatus Aenigmarchaeota archaeon ex4484_14]